MRPAHALDLKPSRRKASGVESHQALSSGAKKSPTRAISRKANSVPEQRVTFKNKVSGKNLVGTFIQGVGASEKRAVVLCHGFASHKDGFHFPQIAKQLSQRSVGSLRFDFAGNGESEGTFEFGNYFAEAEDLRSAVQFLRDKGHKVVAIVGHSKGGNTVLIYSSIYDDVPNVVNVAGRFDLKRGITERFGADVFVRIAQDKQIPMETNRDDRVKVSWILTKWSLQDRLDLDMRAVASKIKQSEVLTVHGSKDEVIPDEDAKQWGSCIKNHELRIIDGADHGFTSAEHSEAMISAVIDCCTN